MEQGQKSKGKRKIVMETIVNKAKRQVTFSKRRSGLFKKASELSIICGAQVAVITFSNAGKPFAFSHPVSPDQLIGRFVNHSNTIDSNPVVFAEKNDGGPIKIHQHYYINKIMMANKSMPSGSSNGGFWWDKCVDDLGLAKLEFFKESLEGLRNQVISKLENKTRVHQDFDMGSNIAKASYGVEKSFDNVPLLEDHHGFTGESSKLDNVGQSSKDNSIGCFMDENGVAADQLSFDHDDDDDQLSFAWKNKYDTEDHGLSGDALLDMLLNGY